MKKAILFLAVAALGLTTSCKKARTCSCSVTETQLTVQNSNSNQTTQITTYTNDQTIDKLSKKDAKRESVCYSRTEVDNYSYGGASQNNFTVTDTKVFSCTLK